MSMDPRKETEPVQPEPVIEIPVPQETTTSINQEPVIELPISPGRQAQQEKELLLEETIQQGLAASAEPTPQPEPARQQGADSQWLRWVGEQVVVVMSQIEVEERAKWDQLFTTTKELEKAWSRI